jgi:hypothetical protein
VIHSQTRKITTEASAPQVVLTRVPGRCHRRQRRPSSQPMSTPAANAPPAAKGSG